MSQRKATDGQTGRAAKPAGQHKDGTAGDARLKSGSVLVTPQVSRVAGSCDKKVNCRAQAAGRTAPTADRRVGASKKADMRGVRAR